MAVMILDLETEYRRDLVCGSSPDDPNLYIVAAGWCVEEEAGAGTIEGRYFDKDSGDEIWLNIPDDVTMIVGHNVSFDVLWLLHRQPHIIEFFRRGGLLFDTQLAELLLSRMQNTYAKLDEIAPDYGGTHKVDIVSTLWAQGIRTSEIEKEVLFDKYLLGTGEDQCGDIENTRRVFWGQVQALQDRGMWNNAVVRMKGLLFNILAMSSGLHIDTEIAREHIDAYREEKERLEAEVTGYFQRQLPEVAEVSLTRHKLSSLIFGGYYEYEGREARTTAAGEPMYVKKDVWEFADGTKHGTDGDLDALELKHGKAVRYKSGKNKGTVKVLRVDTDEIATKKCKLSVTLKGMFPYKDLPSTFREFLDRETKTQTFADGTPVLPTSEAVLEALKNVPGAKKSHEILDAIMRIAQIQKDLGTYYLYDDGKKVSGALKYLQGGNLIHHELKVVGTTTGRLSSSRPNMQNIPRDGTSRVKEIFTSRFNDKEWLQYALERGIIPEHVYDDCLDGIRTGELRGVVVEADYSALEVVTLAVMSGDHNLMKFLKDGTDMHCMRLASTLHEDYNDVVLKCKDEGHPDHKEYKKLRTNIKPKAFQYQYGGSAFGISLSTGCSIEEAEEFIATEKALFPEVEEWYENVVYKSVADSKHYERRMVDDGSFSAVGIGYYKAPSGTEYSFIEQPKTKWVNGEQVRTMEFPIPQMRNRPVQGEASFFVQGMMGELAYAIVQKRWDGLVYIINAVHDAAYLDVYKPMLKKAAKLTKIIMEQVPEVFRGHGYNIEVPFPVEVEAGPSMYNKHHVEV